MSDLLLDENFDLLFKNGDLVIGESTNQHQELLLLTAKGEWRENPLRGVHLRNYLLDENAGQINSIIKREFEADGMTVQTVNTRSGKLYIEATYG
ncbi:MAG: oxidase [Bacteroidetes bacterium]|nr:MAG: oxidase [Bacteroidota bacterium]